MALVAASRVLPLRVILIWASSDKKGLAASRSDLEILVVVTALIVIGVWILASLVLSVIPARHVLVPHAAYWKSGGRERVREMRRRFAIYVSRAIGITFWFLTAEVLVAIVTQKNGLLESPWLPVVVSLLYIVALLVFAVWVFADGFQPRHDPGFGSAAPRPPTSGGAGSGRIGSVGTGSVGSGSIGTGPRQAPPRQAPPRQVPPRQAPPRGRP